MTADLRRSMEDLARRIDERSREADAPADGLAMDDFATEIRALATKTTPTDRADLLDLLADLADPDPCEFDHHGYCQAHRWMQTEPRCPHARARELLVSDHDSTLGD